MADTVAGLQGPLATRHARTITNSNVPAAPWAALPPGPRSSSAVAGPGHTWRCSGRRCSECLGPSVGRRQRRSSPSSSLLPTNSAALPLSSAHSAPSVQVASPTPIFGASATFGGTGFGGFSGVAAGGGGLKPAASGGETEASGEGGDEGDEVRRRGLVGGRGGGAGVRLAG